MPSYSVLSILATEEVHKYQLIIVKLIPEFTPKAYDSVFPTRVMLSFVEKVSVFTCQEKLTITAEF